ncbi:hypothetical protein FRC01_013643 [Tulasnella sp. 417]|nr:hypothetical protein FRC01_013643 [Tulasnella sp. 417]
MHIPIASMRGLPFHQLHPDEHPLSPSDNELMDYGAEYAASRRPRNSTALMRMESASDSDRLERMSNGSGTSRARAHMVPLPVYIKYLRYGTIIEGDIHLTISAKQVELKRILEQMKKWTSLRDRNILPFIGYQWKDTPLLVFHWYKNGNISQYIKANPEVDRLKLLAQVASGLKFLHSESIVHGAIKLTNVIIADDGRPMLMDFGMAPDLRMVERNIMMADSGRENVGYMSPELIEGGNYTAASDVYAFASLVLEILSGQPPYYKFAYVQAMIQITQQKKPSPDDHPNLPASSPLWELMQLCWSTSPGDRPTIEQIRVSLYDAARGLEHLHFLKPPIIHGDIKPDNVMITSELRAVLADFGVSRLMAGLGVCTGLTTTGDAWGPPGYRAVELMLTDDARPTDNSDVYSFGGLILATMTGNSPFWKLRNDAVIVSTVIKGITPKPEDHTQLPPTDSLWVLMRKCWKTRPTQRPRAKEIIDELEAEIGHHAGSR